MTKSHSDNKPEVIEIDKIVNGVARVLIRWNIHEVPAPVMYGEKVRTQWEYDSEVIHWTLPTPDLTPDQIAAYFKETQTEIEGFAKAKRINWKRTDEKIDIDAAIVAKSFIPTQTHIESKEPVLKEERIETVKKKGFLSRLFGK